MLYLTALYGILSFVVLGCFASTDDGCCYTYTLTDVGQGYRVVNVSATPNYAISAINVMQAVITLNSGLVLDPSLTQVWPDPALPVANCSRMYFGTPNQFMCYMGAPLLTIAFRYSANDSTLALSPDRLSLQPVASMQLYTGICSYSSVGCTVIPEKAVFNLSSQLSLGALGKVPLWAVIAAGVCIFMLTVGCSVYIAKLYIAKRNMQKKSEKEALNADSVKGSDDHQIDMQLASPAKSAHSAVSRLSVFLSRNMQAPNDADDDVVYKEHGDEHTESSRTPEGRINMAGGHFRDMSNVSVLYHTRPQSNSGQTVLKASGKRASAKSPKRLLRLIPFSNVRETLEEEEDSFNKNVASPVKNMVIDIPPASEVQSRRASLRNKSSPAKAVAESGALSPTLLKSSARSSLRLRSPVKSPTTKTHYDFSKQIQSPSGASVTSAAFTDYSVALETPQTPKRASSVRHSSLENSKRE